jgi:hypothetical protein
MREARLALRWLAGLPAFLRAPLSAEECRRRVAEALAGRRQAFLEVLRSGVYGSARSPYRRLVEHARLPFAEVAGWVDRDGVEGALERLWEAGVRLSLEEFKGRRPIRRPGLELAPAAADFDLPRSGWSARTGGSRGRPTPVIIDHALLTHEAAYSRLSLEAAGLGEPPVALWRPLPPGVAGLKDALRHAKHGRGAAAWFSPTPFAWGPGDARFALFTLAVLAVARLAGRRLPWPRHVPLAQAAVCARWLAAQRERGTPGLLETTPSAAVRVCLAAREAGLEIAGSVFRVGGEPLTPARAAAVEAAGCRALPRYSLAEAGNLGLACGRPAHPDEVHLLTDKVAVLQRERAVGGAGERVGALVLTTLMPSSPKLLLNVEIDDYGVLGERPCGCPLAALGLTRTLHTVRSFDKLTTLGMSFLGGELVAVLDEVLPARFGGAPGDYQLVERESAEGLPRLELVVHPRVGEVVEGELVEALLAALGDHADARRMMARLWREGAGLAVVRGEPLASAACKVLPLHRERRSA